MKCISFIDHKIKELSSNTTDAFIHIHAFIVFKTVN